MYISRHVKALNWLTLLPAYLTLRQHTEFYITPSAEVKLNSDKAQLITYLYIDTNSLFIIH